MKRIYFLNNWRRRIVFYIAVTILFAAALEIIRIRTNSLQKLAAEKNRQNLQIVIPFQRLELPPHHHDSVRFWQNSADARDFIKFRSSFFAATGGGLVEYDESGKILKHFTVSDGLPESDLTRLAVFKDRLFIGTKSKNLVEFDGENFRRFQWTDRETQAVTAFLNDGAEKLLIGTFGGGLIEYDGQIFREIKAENKQIKAVNCLYKKNSRLYIGTYADGLFINDAGRWQQFTNADGLPSNRIVGIAETENNLLVATDLGAAQTSLSEISDAKIITEKTFSNAARLPLISDLKIHGEKMFLTRTGGEIYEIFENKNGKIELQKSFASNEKKFADARFAEAGEQLFLIGKGGIRAINGDEFSAESGENTLTNNFISSIAFDADGNFWAGTFRDGIDVFSRDGRKIRHLETETVREINALVFDAGKKQMLAATNNGAFNFDEGFKQNELATSERLPGNAILSLAKNETAYALATGKGLLLNENGKIRVFSTFNGLPNNNIYAALFADNRLFIGTLGGLAEIAHGKVRRVFKDSNSALEQNWVTALALAGNRIFIGTYGGGIFELTASGEIRSFASDAGKFVVNPNALFSDGERLYAGTLDGARVLDLETQEWTILRKHLPSEAVFAVAGNENSVFFGTTNGIAQIGKDYFKTGETE